ncbi:MAG: S-layer homology domain-containing protein [Clostridiales Family XIII bacterium]|jgi:hypothetical protein|nr:S-layer homology domain-containing protein [Clostridiales Family XIII bacterium]
MNDRKNGWKKCCIIAISMVLAGVAPAVLPLLPASAHVAIAPYSVAYAQAAVPSSVNTAAVGTGASRMTRGAFVSKAVNALFRTEEYGFVLHEVYCQHPRGNGGYVHMVPDDGFITDGFPALCLALPSISASGFSDDNTDIMDLSVCATIAKELEIIDGYGDGTYRPDSPITVNEALKILVCTFYPNAYTAHQYPEAYIAAARRMGILDGFSYSDGNAILSAKDALKLLGNCKGGTAGLNVRVMRDTPQACAEAYAEAEKTRNGLLQCALLGESAAYDSAYESVILGHNWVTGASSPWIESYDIEDLGGLKYRLSFHMADSTGALPAHDRSVEMELFESGGFYHIKEISPAPYSRA